MATGFFNPMARQHAVVMNGRPHYCMNPDCELSTLMHIRSLGLRFGLLEIMAAHEDYRKRGLASTLLKLGCAAADNEGWESYLDAAPTATALYEKHGYIEQPSMMKRLPRCQWCD